jgi:hypothetical protein
MAAYFNGLLTEFHKSPLVPTSWNPALSMVPHIRSVSKTGNITVKIVVILAAGAFLTVNAVAAMPSAPAKADGKSEQPVLFMAEQELPFDRYWSKN